MKALNYQTGKLGENLAQEFLEKKGYQIISTNFRTRFGEIDLITTKDKKLAFVEVKLKIGDRFGSPEEMINKTKITKVQKMAWYFLQNHPEIAKKYPFHRIEAVCIVLDQDKNLTRINHWENLENEMV